MKEFKEDSLIVLQHMNVIIKKVKIKAFAHLIKWIIRCERDQYMGEFYRGYHSFG